MWASCCVLLVGNVAIGHFEAWLLTRWKSESKPAGTWMIAANYVSMFAGAGLLWLAEPLRTKTESAPFSLGIPVYVGLWITAYLITVFLEWPFIAYVCQERLLSIRALLKSVWVNAVSYALLIALSLWIGSISALTQLRLVSVKEISTSPGWVYYIGPDDSSVWRVRLDGSKSERVMPLPITGKDGWRRITIEATRNADRSRLLFRNTRDAIELQKNVGEARQSAPIKRRTPDGLAEIGNLVFGEGRQFADTPKVYTGYWGLEGIRIDGKWLALETPVLTMPWRSQIVLPDGKVVVQFGGAIVLIDPKTNRVAELAVGTGPDVLLDLLEVTKN